MTSFRPFRIPSCPPPARPEGRDFGFRVLVPQCASRKSSSAALNSSRGFTLLEVLVAVAVLGIAITVVLQLFSADMRAISASADYVSAVTKAEVKIREILDNDKLTETSSSETTRDGYTTYVSVTQALKDRTENIQVVLLSVSVTVYWTQGTKEKSVTLNTMKAVPKQI